jgi:hypothetical protein
VEAGHLAGWRGKPGRAPLQHRGAGSPSNGLGTQSSSAALRCALPVMGGML